MKVKELIRFDWAMKKMLRQKANFVILEGFLSELLSEKMIIKQILESESNRENEKDKQNRVDILVENSKGELIIIEVQNSKEFDYFHRILYGTSKVISEYLAKGDAYSAVKKVISITIAYFDLGQGQDYVYYGTTTFRGIHKGDILNMSEHQMQLYGKNKPSEIFPEYWIIKVSKFSNRVRDKIDEWIYFLKNGAVRKGFSAQGLDEAKEILDEMKLDEKERKAYNYYLRSLHDVASDQLNKMIEVKELVKKATQEIEAAKLEAEKQAKESEKQAKEFEAAKIASEKQAKESEKQAKESEKQAKESEKQAKEFEAAKIASEKQAKESEKQAKESEKQAKESEKQAKEAEKQAKEFKAAKIASEKQAKEALKRAEEAEQKIKEAEEKEILSVTGLAKIGLDAAKISEILGIPMGKVIFMLEKNN